MAALHIEVLKKAKRLRSKRSNKDIEIIAKNFASSLGTINNGQRVDSSAFRNFPDCLESIQKIAFTLSGFPHDKAFLVGDFLDNSIVYVYEVRNSGPFKENIAGEEENAAPVIGSEHWILPNAGFDELFDNLHFDTNLKEELVNYAETMLQLSDDGCNSSIVTSNRVVLFHGPPGTGKTTLCKAIAQKLSIRFANRFPYSQLVEINSHSLFSKWFSESGKLVSKMFESIREILQNENCLVFVLIDEIESLTRSRQSSGAGNEPSDAVRVVNAVLTQLDQLRRYPNVLVFTTSNVADSVDPAFLDRTDIKQFVPPPSYSAIYRILYSCVKELQRISRVTNEFIEDKPSGGKNSKLLIDVSKKCVGLSGRTLRKLPVSALTISSGSAAISVEKFVSDLSIAVDRYKTNSSMITGAVVGPKASQSQPVSMDDLVSLFGGESETNSESDELASME